jgi:hypothetical protein
MTSNARRQHFLSFSSQSRKSSSWGVALGITILGVFLSASAEAAVFTVNNPTDPLPDAKPGDGICDILPPANACTLRAAIQEANRSPGGGATIILPALPPGSFYTLQIPASGSDDENTGDLNITSSMEIVGGGPASTIIDGNGSVTKDRVFNIAAGITVHISGVTVRNGTSNGFGGGIANFGTLALTNSTVSGNSARVGGSGIYNNRGTLALINSTVSANSASDNAGGIYNNAGTLALTNSTVSGNSTIGNGAGIYQIGGTLTLTNSTVSGNNAGTNGAGIYQASGTVSLFNATITRNLAGFMGGGVYVFPGATFKFQNTILAQNGIVAFPPIPSDCAGTVTSNGNNLIQQSLTGSGCTVVGGGVTGADPLLDSNLQDNGGPTQTHALLAGSPAIDAGNSAGCRDQFGALLTTDQRGFPRSIDGNNDGVIRCDIGAYEVFTGSNTNVVAALLPSSRSVQVGTAATVFGTMINTGQSIAAACSITLPTGIPATFQYQTTDPATNQVTGLPNTAVTIAPGAAQSFILAITPTAPFPPTDVQFSFDCANSDPAPVNTGLNTLLLSASNTPVPDIVALAATTTNDGIVNVPGTTGTGAFAVATVNVGASGSITASADTGIASLLVNIFLCQTDPGTGQCISTVDTSVTTTINANATPTFGIFVQGNGNVPFDPATNRIFVRFKDGGGVTRGSTSVAVRTQ